MTAHARLVPGRLTDLGEPLEIRIHAPARAAAATLKVWELDSFYEGSTDDLLATFEGAIEPAPRNAASREPTWRKLVVSRVAIVAAPPEVVRFRLRIAGSPAVHEIPILSEDTAAEGEDFEIGVSLEIGGAEQFRSRAPTLIAVPRDPLRMVEARFGDVDDGGEPLADTVEERPLRLRFAALGVPDGDPGLLATKLRVLGNGHVDQRGLVVVHPDERDGATTSVLQARRGRALYLFIHDDPAPRPLGPSRIPIALCDRLGDEGVTRLVLPDRSYAPGAQILEASTDRVEHDGRHRSAAPAEPPGEAPSVDLFAQLVALIGGAS